MVIFVATEDERLIIAATLRAEQASFVHRVRSDGEPGVVIRAELIRRLMIGVPLAMNGDQAGETRIDIPGAGIRLTHVRIDDDLDLRYGCMPNGEEMPRLSMENCIFNGRIYLTAARIRRLCLKGSQVSLVLANQALISGQLDIREVSGRSSLLGAQGTPLCRFALRGAHIQDGIDARNASLASDEKRPDYKKYATRARYALDLPEAKIGGDLRLFPDFSAIGGVNINGAQIQGSVQAHGALFTAEEMYAFEASNAQIQGRMALDSRQSDGDSKHFRCTGEMRLTNTMITGGLNMQGARVEGMIDASLLKTGGDVNLSSYSAFVGGQPAIFAFEGIGPIRLRGAQIGGTLNMQGAWLDEGLDAPTCTIQVNADFGTYNQSMSGLHQRLTALKSIDLSGARIRGNIIFEGAQLRGGLLAKGLTAGGYARMGQHAHAENYLFQAFERVDLSDATVAFDLDMSGAQLSGPFQAPNLRVGGKLVFSGITGKNGKIYFRALERINLSGANIGSDFVLLDAHLARGLRFRGGNVESTFYINIRGGKQVRIDGLMPMKSSIDLTNAHANIIADYDEMGRPCYDDNFILNLEGFTYGRFWEQADVESNLGNLNEAVRDKPARRRDWLSWLDLQYENPKDRSPYSPAPYDTLIHVMRRNGDQISADSVLVHKLSLEHRQYHLLVRIPLWLVGKLFRHGLSPLRATLTYLCFLSIVAMGVIAANPASDPGLKHVWPEWAQQTGLESPVLVRRIDPAQEALESGIHTPQLGVPVTVQTDPASSAFYKQDIPCGGAINPLLYAAEIVVPTLDLNQKARCVLSNRAPFGWQFMAFLMTLIGWIMTSLFVLTWTGTLRRQIEPQG